MSEAVRFPVETGFEDQRVRGRVLRDFRVSFRFSQGDDINLHYDLFTILDGVYRQTWPSDVFDRFVANADAFDDAAASKLPMPKSHAPVTDPSFQFNMQWRRFKDQLRGNLAPHPDEATLGAHIEALGSEMIAKDRVFIDPRGHRPSGRPGRQPGHDPYASLYRDYVISGQPTGSVAFDAVMGHMRQQTMANGPSFSLQLLQRDWETRHPDTNFYPDSYLAEVAEKGYPLPGSLDIAQHAGSVILSPEDIQ
jgi:hypothetical protein